MNLRPLKMACHKGAALVLIDLTLLLSGSTAEHEAHPVTHPDIEHGAPPPPPVAEAAAHYYHESHPNDFHRETFSPGEVVIDFTDQLA